MFSADVVLWFESVPIIPKPIFDKIKAKDLNKATEELRAGAGGVIHRN
jgi:hypothetical protein